MFSKNPFSEYRATQQQVQEKKVIDKDTIDGSTIADVDASIQEQKFVIPEEIPATERTAFHGAAAGAAKAGKKAFNFGGKSYPVTMAKDTAQKIADEKLSSKEKMKRGLYNDTQKEGMYKDMDTEKGESNPRSGDKVKADMKKRRGMKDEVKVNPKMEKETAEQKESTSIRAKLMDVLSENDRAKHYKGATKPDEYAVDRNASAKKMKDGHGDPKVDDTEEKGHQDAVKAGKTGPTAKPRSGSDATRSGDQKIVKGGTPVNKLTKTMEAYASMYEKVDAHNFPKGQKPHPAVIKHAKEFDAMDVHHDYHKDGHSVQSHGGDEYEAYHHVDDKGKHQGHYLYDHETRGGAEAPSKKEIKKALPNSPDHVHTAIHKQIQQSM